MSDHENSNRIILNEKEKAVIKELFKKIDRNHSKGTNEKVIKKNEQQQQQQQNEIKKIRKEDSKSSIMFIDDDSSNSDTEKS
jgi:hypothetical protein